MTTMTVIRRIIASLVLAAAATTVAAGASSADTSPSLPVVDSGEHPDAHRLAAAQGGLIAQVFDGGEPLQMSAAEAASKARDEYGGKVLSVSQVGTGVDAHYNIRLLNDGNVRIVRIPPKEQQGDNGARATD